MVAENCTESPHGQVVGDDAPFPPRYWWLRRIGVGVAMLAAALLLARHIWGVAARRALRAEIDRVAAAGQPIRAADFAEAPVAAEDNAAIPLTQAFKLLDATPCIWDLASRMLGEQDTSGIPSGPGPKPGDPATLDAVAAGAAKALDLVRQARGLRGCDWGVDFSSGVMLADLPYLGQQRKVARFLAALAARRYELGDHRAAVQLLRDVMFLAKVTDSHPRTLVSHMVALGMGDLVADAVQTTGANLEPVETASSTVAVSRPAALDDLRGLLGDILDEAEPRRSIVEGFYWVPVTALELHGFLSEGRYSLWYFAATYGGVLRPMTPSRLERVWMRAAEPLVSTDAAKVVAYFTAVAEAAHEPMWPSVRERLPQALVYPGYFDDWFTMAHPIRASTYFDPGHAFLTHFEQLARRRMAAIALAMRLYELEHARRPEDLDQLVPEYLAAVPQDPFSPQGQPIVYLPGGPRTLLYDESYDQVLARYRVAESRPASPRPILYSVGMDGADDQGSHKIYVDAKPVRYYQLGDETVPGDIVFYLDGRPPERAPRSEPSDGAPPSPPGFLWKSVP